MARGRKRKPGKRTACGKLSAEETRSFWAGPRRPGSRRPIPLKMVVLLDLLFAVRTEIHLKVRPGSNRRIS